MWWPGKTSLWGRRAVQGEQLTQTSAVAARALGRNHLRARLERRLQKETVVAVILHTGFIPHSAGGELVSEDIPQTQAVEIGPARGSDSCGHHLSPLFILYLILSSRGSSSPYPIIQPHPALPRPVCVCVCLSKPWCLGFSPVSCCAPHTLQR